MIWPSLRDQLWLIDGKCELHDREALEELVDLFVCHLLAELSEDVAELAGTNEAVTGLVEHLESLDEFLFSLSVCLSGESLEHTSCSSWLPAVWAVENGEELVVRDYHVSERLELKANLAGTPTSSLSVSIQPSAAAEDSHVAPTFRTSSATSACVGF